MVCLLLILGNQLVLIISDALFLKLSVPLIALAKTHTLNLTISNGIILKFFKTACILPLHKDCDKPK